MMRFFRFVCSLMLILATLGIAIAATPATASAQVGIGVGISIAPPALPVYVQPPIPAVGYLWTPGYWAYGPDGYYWVPGTWILPPQPGFLWTPGYWGWNAGSFGWNGGYWGLHVGFYGGINYGFGYGGFGYGGGYWNNGAFFYNRSVNNITNVHITNVYNKTVINNVNVSRTAFNGPGGVTVKPTPEQERVAAEKHVAATAEQTQHEHLASTNRALLASENHGKPAIAATSKPGDFSGHGVVAAKAAGAPYKAPTATNEKGAMSKTNSQPANNPRTAAPSHNTASHMEGTTPRTPPPTHTAAPRNAPPSRMNNAPGEMSHNPPPSRPTTSHQGEMSHNPPPQQHTSAPPPAPRPAPRPAPAPHPAPEPKAQPEEGKPRP